MSDDPAEVMAALWRACRDESQLLQALIRRLEHGVARAMMNPPPPDSLAAWSELLAAERAALEATRARNAMVAALLDGEPR